MSFSEMVTPFWLGTRMVREASCMIEREGGDVWATLLFPPKKLYAVEDHTLDVVFEEGVDYRLEEGTNRLYLLPGSRIPFFTQNDLMGKDPDGKSVEPYPAMDEKGRSRFGDVLYSVSAFLYEKQISITYEFDADAWKGPIPPYVGEDLPRSMGMLKAGEPLKMTFFGDSIFTGCDCSAMYKRPPYQESFPTLVPKALEAVYGSPITVSNLSVGGMDSLWGLNQAQQVIDTDPDLVFIGFGMNDGGRTALEAAENIKGLITRVKEACPRCEFVVTTPMVPNAKAGFLCDHARLPQAYAALRGEGVAFVDFFSMHAEMLKEKDFVAMSGNNINHPNDWLIRTYTMTFLSALIEDPIRLARLS